MSLETEWFNYELPRRLVAQEPLRRRSDARLMVVDRRRQEIEHHHVRDLPNLLAAGDRLVLNDTKVIPARLVGQRAATLGRWQGLFLESTRDGLWRILCKTRGRLSPGETIRLFDREGRPGAELRLVEQLPGGEWLVKPASEEPANAVLERLGRVPLPPYIRGGNMVDADVANYQTVYARNPGAVAAPTAGLHLTKELLGSLADHGIGATAVTLHVGLGTFRPIETERLESHQMHSEWGQVTATAAAEMNQARAAGGRVVAVGTTVVRLLETAVRAGGARGDVPLGETVPGAERGNYIPISPWQGKTEMFIRPPFEFQAVDALMTNFHFPRTTLLVLVQTFAGRELIKAAYEQAVREEYRFYSYGDAMLIL
jgi:S-adenosylmethionine:tRNA ribosyltransferase-isomerase